MGEKDEQMNNLKKALNRTLFWDVDVKKLDYKKHANFIIERILSFGDEKDFKILQKIYNLNKIKKAAIKLNYPDKKTINFWSVIFDIPFNSFLCIKKLSILKPNAFWKR